MPNTPKKKNAIVSSQPTSTTPNPYAMACAMQFISVLSPKDAVNLTFDANTQKNLEYAIKTLENATPNASGDIYLPDYENIKKIILQLLSKLSEQTDTTKLLQLLLNTVVVSTNGMLTVPTSTSYDTMHALHKKIHANKLNMLNIFGAYSLQGILPKMKSVSDKPFQMRTGHAPSMMKHGAPHAVLVGGARFFGDLTDEQLERLKEQIKMVADGKSTGIRDLLRSFYRKLRARDFDFDLTEYESVLDHIHNAIKNAGIDDGLISDVIVDLEFEAPAGPAAASASVASAPAASASVQPLVQFMPSASSSSVANHTGLHRRGVQQIISRRQQFIQQQINMNEEIIGLFMESRGRSIDKVMVGLFEQYTLQALQDAFNYMFETSPELDIRGFEFFLLNLAAARVRKNSDTAAEAIQFLEKYKKTQEKIAWSAKSFGAKALAYVPATAAVASGVVGVAAVGYGGVLAVKGIQASWAHWAMGTASVATVSSVLACTDLGVKVIEKSYGVYGLLSRASERSHDEAADRYLKMADECRALDDYYKGIPWKVGSTTVLLVAGGAAALCAGVPVATLVAKGLAVAALKGLPGANVAAELAGLAKKTNIPLTTLQQQHQKTTPDSAAASTGLPKPNRLHALIQQYERPPGGAEASSPTAASSSSSVQPGSSSPSIRSLLSGHALGMAAASLVPQRAASAAAAAGNDLTNEQLEALLRRRRGPGGARRKRTIRKIKHKKRHTKRHTRK